MMCEFLLSFELMDSRDTNSCFKAWIYTKMGLFTGRTRGISNLNWIRQVVLP